MNIILSRMNRENCRISMLSQNTIFSTGFSIYPVIICIRNSNEEILFLFPASERPFPSRCIKPIPFIANAILMQSGIIDYLMHFRANAQGCNFIVFPRWINPVRHKYKKDPRIGIGPGKSACIS